MVEEYAQLTPEKVAVSFQLAGLGPRIAAQFLDVILIVAIEIGLANVISALPPALQSVGGIFAFFTPFLYFILLEGLWNGQTIGKKAGNIRVRSKDGRPITMGQAIYRNLLRPADLFPGFYLIGATSVMMTEQSQRVGDIAAGTIVIHESKTRPTFVPAPHKAGIHPLEDRIPALTGMTRAEYDATKRFCDRYYELPGPVSQHMMLALWGPLSARHGIAKIPNVPDVMVLEAVVMKYGRENNLF